MLVLSVVCFYCGLFVIPQALQSQKPNRAELLSRTSEFS